MRCEEVRRLLTAQKGAARDFAVVVFVPSKTRDGAAINHEFWCNETVAIMAKLFRGATIVEGFGAWRDDEANGAVISEMVSIAFSLMDPADWNKGSVADLGRHLRRMGRETRQGEVGIIVDGKYFPMREFDDEEES